MAVETRNYYHADFREAVEGFDRRFAQGYTSVKGLITQLQHKSYDRMLERVVRSRTRSILKNC